MKIAPLLALVVAASLGAQGLVLRVTTPTGVVARADQAVMSIPPNADLTGGRTLRVTDSATGSYVDAALTTSLAATQSTVALGVTLQATSTMSAFRLATLEQHVVAIRWTSPVPVYGRLRLEWCRDGVFLGTADAVGYGTLSAPGVPRSCQSPAASEYLVRVDAAGLAVDVDAVGFALAGRFLVQVNGRWTATLTIDPSQGCAAQTFGTSCGPVLVAQNDPRFPGHVVLRVDDAAPMAASVLLVGVQRLQLPLPGGCFLHDEVLVALPLPVQGTTASALLDPTPYPGLRLVAQGYVLPVVPAGLRLSQGLELSCR